MAQVARARAQLKQARPPSAPPTPPFSAPKPTWPKRSASLASNERSTPTSSCPSIRWTPRRAACDWRKRRWRSRRPTRSRRPPRPSQSQADVTFAEAQLQNTIIRAPFAGTVVSKMAEVGESVAPIPPGVNISTASGAIVALADLATLEMEADVSEANVAKLVDDQPAEVSVEAFPDRRYKAVLRQIIPTADRTKATVLTKVTLIEKDKDLKPEMSAKVTFLEPPRTRPRGGSRCRRSRRSSCRRPRSSLATAARRCSRSSRARRACVRSRSAHAQRRRGRHRWARRHRAARLAAGETLKDGAGQRQARSKR